MAIAGVLIASFNINIAMWVNSVTFFVCAWVIARLPNLEEEVKEKRGVLTIRVMIADFKIVWTFIQQQRQFLKFFIAYQIALMVAFALDSQEMTFIKKVLSASDSLYGVLVSVAGGGGYCWWFIGNGFSTEISNHYLYRSWTNMYDVILYLILCVQQYLVCNRLLYHVRCFYGI
ncbi:hypothetical protein LSPH24S_02246 [Lysinibacillus sphaericus]